MSESEDPNVIDDLHKALDVEPFTPFRIVTSSGKSYEVEDPHTVAIGKSRISMFPPPAESWLMLRNSEIVALESIQPAA